MMGVQEQRDLEDRILLSPRPWQEVIAWLNDCQSNGWNLPEDGEAYVGKIVLLASTLSGPAGCRAEARHEPRDFFGHPEIQAVFAASRARSAHDKLERSKEILSVIQGVVDARFSGRDDEPFDALAQRLRVLIFGK